MNVVPFPGRRKETQPEGKGAIYLDTEGKIQYTPGKVYALADLLIAAQVALHIHADRSAFQLLFDVIDQYRFRRGAPIPDQVHRQVHQYLPDNPKSMDSRLQLYRQVYGR